MSLVNSGFLSSPLHSIWPTRSTYYIIPGSYLQATQYPVHLRRKVKHVLCLINLKVNSPYILTWHNKSPRLPYMVLINTGFKIECQPENAQMRSANFINLLSVSHTIRVFTSSCSNADIWTKKLPKLRLCILRLRRESCFQIILNIQKF